MSAASNSFDEGFSHDPQIAQLRIPPHSIEAESSVLGGLLLDNGAWDRVGDLLTEGDFYRYEHKLVYTAIYSLVNASRPADVITVYEQLQTLGNLSTSIVIIINFFTFTKINYHVRKNNSTAHQGGHRSCPLFLFTSF